MKDKNSYEGHDINPQKVNRSFNPGGYICK